MIIDTELIDKLIKEMPSLEIAQKAYISPNNVDKYKGGQPWLTSESYLVAQGMNKMIGNESFALKRFIESFLRERKLGDTITEFDPKRLLYGEPVVCYVLGEQKTKVIISLSSLKLSAENSVEVINRYYLGHEIRIIGSVAKF